MIDLAHVLTISAPARFISASIAPFRRLSPRPRATGLRRGRHSPPPVRARRQVLDWRPDRPSPSEWGSRWETYSPGAPTALAPRPSPQRPGSDPSGVTPPPGGCGPRRTRGPSNRRATLTVPSLPDPSFPFHRRTCPEIRAVRRRPENAASTSLHLRPAKHASFNTPRVPTKRQKIQTNQIRPADPPSPPRARRAGKSR